jgi:hypothetical protein
VTGALVRRGDRNATEAALGVWLHRIHRSWRVVFVRTDNTGRAMTRVPCDLRARAQQDCLHAVSSTLWTVHDRAHTAAVRMSQRCLTVVPVAVAALICGPEPPPVTALAGMARSEPAR